jgi:hypothetical protein
LIAERRRERNRNVPQIFGKTITLGTVRNVVRGTAGTALFLAGILVLGVALHGAPWRSLLMRKASDSQTATGAPVGVTGLEPPSLFPAPPSVIGRPDGELARDADVKRLFAPFAARGVMNFVRGHRELVRTDSAAPLSYRWLRAAGKLERVEDFVAIARSPANDRPRWPEPQTPRDWEAARGLLVLYERLGPLWDEDG